jgi:S-adenosylmethionine:tRNA ribosyltransferase-isomerase
MKTSELDFNLPRELVTYGPTPWRFDGRLCVINRKEGWISHDKTIDHLMLLADGKEVWCNDSKLLRARYKLWRDTGHTADMLLVRKVDNGPGQKWIADIPAPKVLLDDRREWKTERKVEVKILAHVANQRWEVEIMGELDPRDGKLPIPPWVRQPADEYEESLYEPLYAKVDGGYFSPTAGIRLGRHILNVMKPKFLTLHIALDSIRTVETETLEEHIAEGIEPEPYTIPSEPGGNVFAVGTTVVKAIETWARTGNLAGKSDLFIGPGFEFKRVGALLTNLHLPRESLLALTCAFGGTDLVMRAYRECVERRYRWSDYGDLVLIL